MQIKKNNKKGFSLVELLVVITLIMILGVITFSNLYKRRNITNLNTVTNQIVALLNEARNRAINQDKDNSWGVYFGYPTSSKSFYALFYSNYSTSTIVKKYLLPNYVYYRTSTVPLGGSLIINFNKISGDPSTTTTIYLDLYQGTSVVASSSININSLGRVSY